MDEQELLAERFAADREHLRSVAYRMLASTTEAEDAVQEAWLRLQRSDSEEIDNLSGWLTTVTARVCLDMLRSRRRKGEEPIDVGVPDPVITRDPGPGPEDQAILADSVGLALLVVLETLEPAERLAFVLHDMFAVPFDEIAAMLDRTPEATRQLASRARRRVQGAPVIPDADVGRQREVVDAFFAAARGGDLEALVAVLDPDVVLRADGGPRRPALTHVIRGAETVAGQALSFRGGAAGAIMHPVLVNGAAGAVVTRNGRPQTVFEFTVVEGRIVAIQILADPERIAGLDFSALEA